MRSAPFAVLVACLASCATLTRDSTIDQRYGAPDPARYDKPAAPSGGMSYRADVQPILERRCVVCHGCYDAPCQLKLGSWEGVARGASTARVFDGGRLDEAPPTRLYVDARQPSEWRKRGFFPVLNERASTPEANLAASVLYRSLALKRAHPLPADAVLPKPFDFSLDRKQYCPRIDEYESYASQFPLAGMPYGLPGLDPREFETVTRWLAAGAPYEGPAPLPANVTREVQAWEAFLNGGSPKERLMSRYLYEHLFLGFLYFDTDADRRAFRIVRSATPPGEPVSMIATRRPYDDPGVPRVYYRLVPERETIVAKTHMPYALSAGRMAKFRTWFLDAPYHVGALPSYAVEVSSNPFIAFSAVPADSRYRFLLDEARFFIQNFTKGPVCRGQLAVDVIEDRFWVFFVAPGSGESEANAEVMARQATNLRLPAEWGSDAPLLRPWLEYAHLETKYLEAKTRLLDQTLAAPGKLDLGLVWDGDGRNSNAALTVFRHFDSASVVQGLVGEPPKTAWVIGYPLFERIYYLLVAGYDVYGNAGHQLTSRLYMDFLRMEGEFNFLVLLPQAARVPTRDYWYRGASDSVKEHVYGRKVRLDRETGIVYRTADPQLELYGMLRARLAPVLAPRFDLSTVADEALRRDLQAVGDVRGASTAWLPEVAFVRVDDPPRPPQWLTLLRDTAHSNVSHIFLENAELLPAENTLTLVPGFIGAYPNAIYRVRRADLPALAAAIRGLGSEDDYRKLADRFAVRRTEPGFWAVSDAMVDAHARTTPLEAGLFDYNRLENR
jgi:Fatty acid cis/trans isomerase (CTI)